LSEIKYGIIKEYFEQNSFDLCSVNTLRLMQLLGREYMNEKIQNADFEIIRKRTNLENIWKIFGEVEFGDQL